MEDLPLGRIAAFVPGFAVKDLPLGRTLMLLMILWERQIIDTKFGENPASHLSDGETDTKADSSVQRCHFHALA